MAGSSSSEDDNVVNTAVATVILPRLRKLALEAYDPFSRSMTSRALHFVEEISYCLETSNQRFQVCRSSVNDVLLVTHQS